jgi:hypothetical protein
MSRPLICHRRIARGEVRADAIYPLSVFLRRLGIGRASLNALRKRGLQVHPIGRRLFVDGGQAIVFLRRLWESDVAP